MDEKHQVISVLRALLVSNSKKGDISLNELKREYCIQEGKKEIPTFEHKNVGDFLLHSGEFIVKVVNGFVTVREKAKLESSHIKKLVTEQRSASSFTNRFTYKKNWKCDKYPVKHIPSNFDTKTNFNHDKSPEGLTRHTTSKKNSDRASPEHILKPSIMFTFDQLKETGNNVNNVTNKSGSMPLNDKVPVKPSNLIKNTNQTMNNTYMTHFQKEAVFKEPQKLSNLFQNDNNMSQRMTPSYTGKTRTTAVNDNRNDYRDTPCTNNFNNNNDAARLQLLETILSFKVISIPNERYKASVSIDNKIYIGYGYSKEEAKNEASVNALKNLKKKENTETEVTGVECNATDTTAVFLNNVTHKFSNCNNNKVRQIEESRFSHSITKNYDKASNENKTLLLLKMKGSNEWKILNKNDESCKVIVKIDGIDYFGEGTSFQAAQNNCIDNAIGSLSTEKQEDSFTTLNNMSIDFYKSLCRDATKKYRAMIQVDSMKYFGAGKSAKEANENAAAEFLNSMSSGKHMAIVNSRAPLEDVAPNTAFITLNKKYAGLTYRTVSHDEDHNYQTVVQVDSVNYYGNGKSFQKAANSAAETCLQSIRIGRHQKLARSIYNLYHQ